MNYKKDLLRLENLNQFNDLELIYYASDIMEKLDCNDSEEMEEAINRVTKVCNSLNLPLNRNFRKIYRYDGKKLCIDWKLSSLACCLLMMNGDPGNPNVAKAQVYFAVNQTH